MMRVERLVVPLQKSCCSSSRVRRPARAHSRAIATPLMPPPITTMSKSPASGPRSVLGSIFGSGTTPLLWQNSYDGGMQLPRAGDLRRAARVVEVLERRPQNFDRQRRLQVDAGRAHRYVARRKLLLRVVAVDAIGRIVRRLHDH